MTAALNVHLVVGIAVVTLALAFGWLGRGRIVVAAAIGAAMLSGIYLIHVAVIGKLPLPGMLSIHIATALAGMGAYIAARRIASRPAAARSALVLSFIGLLLVAVTALLGRALFVSYGL